MEIKELLLNMGSQVIETTFLSKNVLQTLKVYNEDLLIPSNIRGLVYRHIPKAEMLRDKKMRKELIQSMKDEDVKKLAQALMIRGRDNPRAKLLDKKINVNSNVGKKLFEFFNVPYITQLDSNERSDQEKIEPERPLFEHQRDAVDKIQKYLNSDVHAALLHMPTGSGKTRTAMRVISNLFMNEKPMLVIWVALTEELCEQAVEEFQKTWKMVGDRKITIHRFFGSRPPDMLDTIKNASEGFVVASMAKLGRVADEQFLTTLADHIKLVVMDEAHHAIAPTYRRVIEILAKKHTDTRLLGLSATPGRTLRATEQNTQLANFFATNKVTLKIKNQNPLRYLINNKYIAEPDIQIIEHADKLSEADQAYISRRSAIDVPIRVLEKLSSDVARNIKIVSEVEKLVNRGQRRIIVFTPTIQSSRDIAMILSARSFTAHYVDSNISSQLRKSIIDEYKIKSNRTIILCNVKILTTGFDAPETSAVVIARPTKSLVLYSQMIGRAIRGTKVGGNNKCFIRVITDSSIMEFKDIVSAFEHWEEEWK